MDRRSFLLTALKDSKVYYKAKWVFSLFTVVKDSDVSMIFNPYDYQIATHNKQYVYYLNNEWHPIIDGPEITRPLWLVEEGVTINSQNELVQKADKFPFRTRVGTLFVNYYCLVSAFQDRINYQDGELSIKNLEKIVSSRLVEVGTEKQPHQIYPYEAKMFSTACTSMAGFAPISNYSATEYTMTPPPGIKEFRDKLLEKYKDKLTDPAIVAEIDRLLVEYDKEYQKGDGEGGFLNEKYYTIARKRLYSMHGLEQSEVSGGKKVLVPTSLSEGVKVEYLPAMNDSMRDGSFNRGAMTALGGESVKFIFRIFAATKATEENCGSTLGIPMILTESNIKKYIGNTIILKNKTQIKLTEENYNKYVNNEVMVRSPALCKTGNSNYCYTCMGERLRNYGHSLASLASDVGSAMMYVFMKKMHGTSLSTTPWKYKNTIT